MRWWSPRRRGPGRNNRRGADVLRNVDAPDQRMSNARQAASYLGIPFKTFKEWVSAGIIPDYVPVPGSPQTQKWHWEVLLAIRILLCHGCLLRGGESVEGAKESEES
jgi:hypothetical protein